MLRRARRSLPRRDKVHDAHVIASEFSKSFMVGPLDLPAHVYNCEPGAPGPLELGYGTDA